MTNTRAIHVKALQTSFLSFGIMSFDEKNERFTDKSFHCASKVKDIVNHAAANLRRKGLKDHSFKVIRNAKGNAEYSIVIEA